MASLGYSQKVSKKRIGELLRERGSIDDRQLQAALSYQRDHGGRLGTALVAKGFLTEDQLVAVLGQELNLPVIDIPDQIDVAALKLLKARFCEDHDVFPIHLDDTRSGRRVLTLVLSDPLDLPTLEEVEFVTGCRVQAALSTTSQIRLGILRHYHRQNVDQRRAGGRMTVVRPGGVEEEIDTTRPHGNPQVAITRFPRFGEDEDSVVALTEEVTSRTELAELIRDHEEASGKSAGGDLQFLTGETDAERFESLERKFWALMRMMAKKGLITKEEFLEEFDR